MRVRLTQIDGKLANLAMMRLAHYHCAHGDEVHFTKVRQSAGEGNRLATVSIWMKATSTQCLSVSDVKARLLWAKLGSR
jgi:hypothetical protein